MSRRTHEFSSHVTCSNVLAFIWSLMLDNPVGAREEYNSFLSVPELEPYLRNLSLILVAKFSPKFTT